MMIEGVSVVIPVLNEEDNVQPLTEEIIKALTNLVAFEIIFVDDASKDNTVSRLQQLRNLHHMVRVFCHNSNRGQSAAVVTGARQANFFWIATLDGDRQNDPKDLSLLISAINKQKTKKILCMGRRAKREDNFLRKVSSKIANNVRRYFLKDDCVDSGCGIKIFPRDLFLSLPLFRNCHRFLPALFRRAGADILQIDVSHRPRVEGVSKYGVLNRLFAGIVDLLGVSWLMRRFIDREGEYDA